MRDKAEDMAVVKSLGEQIPGDNGDSAANIQCNAMHDSLSLVVINLKGVVCFSCPTSCTAH
jgi:hypothetical protein